jgi:hypothetical protein
MSKYDARSGSFSAKKISKWGLYRLVKQEESRGSV